MALSPKTTIAEQAARILTQRRGLIRLLRNAWLDFRWGGRFLGGHVLPKQQQRDYWGTANTDYDVMARLFSELTVRPDDILVDVGCGKGRTFNWFLQQGWRNRMVGLEIVPELAAFTRSRLRSFANIEIVTGDVRTNLPRGTVYYLFNPFGADTMSVFASAVKMMAQNDLGRPADRPTIVYARCDHLSVFQEDPFWAIREVDLRSFGFLRGAIVAPACPK